MADRLQLAGGHVAHGGDGGVEAGQPVALDGGGHHSGPGGVFRVIEGRSVPAPTIEDAPMRLDAAAYQTGVPELVAAELVRDVVDAKEFDEFCRFDRVTVLNAGKYYRIPRRPHALIEVWDSRSRRPEARLCVIFQDPGMPPSDEVVMKYLLAKHQPDLLWQVGVKFAAPTGRFDAGPPRRWQAD